MSIYRGPGGSGDAINDASSEALLTVQAKDAAIAAQLAAEAAQAAAELAETNAETSATNAASSATSSASSATSASTYATNASNSASAASTSATTAATSATNAANSASAASTSATNAASSATSASSSASTATTQATNASNSATAAATSATNASNSATAAATSATNAASSATSASGSASTATTQASNASTSATNAAASATSASGSASTATTQAGIATTQATNAASSASAAATSATNASNSASTATTQAGIATTQASNAASSASAAATSASDAATLYDNFDDRYLGAKSSAPTLDNDGNALLTGALYFNTSTNSMKVWSGSAWLDAYASLSGAVTSVAATAPIQSSGGTAPTISITQATTSTNGYLSSTDWNTFNNKQPAGTYATGTGTASGTNTGDETTSSIKTKLGAASTSADGYLTSTDWNTFNGKQAALSSGTNIKTVGGVSLLGSGDVGTLGISYGGTGQTTASAAFNALSPITTTGDIIIGTATNTSSRLAAGASGYLLTSNGAGVAPSWQAAPVSLPTQTGNTGKFLKTDGTTASWSTLPTVLPILNRAGASVSVAVGNGLLPILNRAGSTVNVAVT